MLEIAVYRCGSGQTYTKFSLWTLAINYIPFWRKTSDDIFFSPNVYNFFYFPDQFNFKATAMQVRNVHEIVPIRMMKIIINFCKLNITNQR